MREWKLGISSALDRKFEIGKQKTGEIRKLRNWQICIR